MITNSSVAHQGCDIINYFVANPRLREIIEFIENKEYIIYPENIILQAEKEKADSITFLLSGAVSLSFTNEKGEHQLLDIIGAGEIMGFSNIVLDSVSRYTAKTLKVTSCIAIKKKLFLDLLFNNTDFARRMLNISTADAGKKEKKLTGLKSQEPYERLCTTVKRMSEIFSLDKNGLINYEFTFDMLKQIVSTNTKELSLAFSKMEQNKLASFNNGAVEIIDRKALHKEVAKIDRQISR